MIKYLAVVPFIYPPYAEALKATLKLPEENVIFIDNTDINRGVAGSWNVGIDMLEERDANWLIILSAAMRFGEPGGLDMISQIEKYPAADVVRFARKNVAEQPFDSKNKINNPAYPDCFYWHCTAISRELVEHIGKFDANFYPIYFEDTDYDLRIKKAGYLYRDFIVSIDAHSESAGHAQNLAKVHSNSTELIAYFATKWGRHPAAVQLGDYDQPFNDPTKPLAFWPPANGDIWDE